MTSFVHVPVLLEEILDFFSFHENTIYVDGTLGLGGHAAHFLEHIPSLQTCLGNDADATHIALAKKRLLPYDNKATLIFEHNWIHNLYHTLKEHQLNGKVTSLLLDLGICAAHLDHEERGFTFRHNGPLDMRYNIDQAQTAAVILNKRSEQELADIFYYYGEEPRARVLAKLICDQRKQKQYEVTHDFLDTLHKLFGQTLHNQTLARLFQALRIAVNTELDDLERILKDIPKILAPGGRLAIISYHSLEDRLVKQYFKTYTQECLCPKEQLRCTCKGIAQFLSPMKKPITPTAEEISRNPKSRSAKLRLLIHNSQFYSS